MAHATDEARGELHPVDRRAHRIGEAPGRTGFDLGHARTGMGESVLERAHMGLVRVAEIPQVPLEPRLLGERCLALPAHALDLLVEDVDPKLEDGARGLVAAEDAVVVEVAERDPPRRLG